MVTFKVIAKEDDVWTYKYWPWGDKEPGIISININTLEHVHVEYSPEDYRHKYADQFLDHLVSIHTNGEVFPEADSLIWM